MTGLHQFHLKILKALIFNLSILYQMMMLKKSVVFICMLATVAYAVPAQEKRVHHHADLSDHVHNDAEGFQYDHEAFLGKEEAKTFDQLTPEESKEKLA